MRPDRVAPLLLVLVLCLCGCRDGGTPGGDANTAPGARDGTSAPAAVDAAPAAVPPDAPTLLATVPPELHGRTAAHWFGRQWPKNWLAGFRRAEVAADFETLKQDGFDTVVLLVAWGDFQPVAMPCCTWDERAFERLRFVLDRAREAGLKVMLRVGYGWSFHPGAGDVGERQHQLMNRADVRASYFDFVRRIGAEVDGRDEVVLAFMSWEDQWLRRIDETARSEFDEHAATRPADFGTPRPLPDVESDARGFHRYWDWLVREKLYAPAVGMLPNLSYEARIDREPVWTTDAGGKRVVGEWLAHDGMYELPGAPLLTIYWAPFWGALNQGEQLTAGRSLELLTALLREARERGGKALFVDQFNVVDNTPGHESNAVLAPAELPAFLHRAACTLRREGVAAVGIWTARDYAENPLHNPAFGYGLEAWDLRDGGVAAPSGALEAMPEGDFRVRMQPGRTLAQQIPRRHGRMPRSGDALADHLCVRADVRAPGQLSATAGGAAVTLSFREAGLQRACTAIAPEPDDDGIALALTLRDGDIAVRDVQLYDHLQYGGLRDVDGAPGPLLEPMRRFLADFAAEPAPARCVQ